MYVSLYPRPCVCECVGISSYAFIHERMWLCHIYEYILLLYALRRCLSLSEVIIPRHLSYGIYISQLVRFARCCTSILKMLKSLQNYWQRITDITNFEKHLGKFFRSKFGETSFQTCVLEGISQPVFYGDLVYKLRRDKGAANFVLSVSKIVKRLQRRKYDPVIIERTIGLVLVPWQPCTDPS